MALIETAEPLITPKEMAALIKVSEQTLAVWRKRNLVPYIRVGNVVRYDPQRVLEALRK